MTARFCTHCGRPVLATSSFCSACGAPVGWAAPPPLSSPGGALPPAYPSSPPPFAPRYSTATSLYPPSPASPASDLSALSSVILATAIGLFGAALGLVELLTTPATTILSSASTSSGTTLSVDFGALYLVLAYTAVGLALGLLELWMYRQAFQTLSSQDRSFSTPASATLAAIIALLFIVLIGVAFVGVVIQAGACAGPGRPITSACLNEGTVLALLAVLGIVAIVALVGYLGLLVGIWRLGTRYRDGKFRIGAILLLLPVADLVGMALILVAAHAARAQVQSGTARYTY